MELVLAQFWLLLVRLFEKAGHSIAKFLSSVSVECQLFDGAVIALAYDVSCEFDLLTSYVVRKWLSLGDPVDVFVCVSESEVSPSFLVRRSLFSRCEVFCECQSWHMDVAIAAVYHEP